MKRFRPLIWIFFSFATFYVILFQWVNWKGARDWKATQAELERDKETLSIRKIALPAVPDADNFCAIPVLKDIALAKDAEAAKRRQRLEVLKIATPRQAETDRFHLNGLAGASDGVPLNVEGWSQWLRQEGSLPFPVDSGVPVKDWLAAMKKLEPGLMEELVAGLSHKEAQWTPSWRTRELPGLLLSIESPHYKSIQSFSRYLGFRAIAAAHAGDFQAAHEAAALQIRLCEATLNEPQLIGQLVGLMQLRILTAVVWEMTRLHAGTAEDFHRLETGLRRLDLSVSMLLAFRAERAFGINAIEEMKRSDDPLLAMVICNWSGDKGRSSGFINTAQSLIPQGFFDLNASAACNLYSQHLVIPMKKRGLLALLEAPAPDLKKRHPMTHPGSVLAGMMLPSIESLRFTALYAQCLSDQALVACVLEQHFLNHQAYPANLSEITAALPHDLLSGQPIRYERTEGGRYRLWSVGFDRRDDGGKRGRDADDSGKVRPMKADYLGDWVWDFPADGK